MEIKRNKQTLKIKAAVPEAVKGQLDDLRNLNVKQWIGEMREKAINFRRGLRR